jgi:hypothetical protein
MMHLLQRLLPRTSVRRFVAIFASSLGLAGAGASLYIERNFKAFAEQVCFMSVGPLLTLSHRNSSVPSILMQQHQCKSHIHP